MIVGYDHVQVAIPRGADDIARSFYGGVLGLQEVPKPPALRGRGGCWFESGSAVLHLGVEEPFTPARKAHPAFLVTSLAAVRSALEAAGHECVDGSGERPGIRRVHAYDPFGNRLEFQQA